MVTTRSAEKRAKTDNTENLALRSKPEESVSVRRLGSDLSSPSLLKSKSKVVVNVPLPRKRTRVNRNGTDEMGSDPKSVEEEVSEAGVRRTDDTKTEIPDSQESPSKPDGVKGYQLQSSYVLSEEGKSPARLGSSTKRKRKATENNHSKSHSPIVITSTQVATNKHKRYDSEGRYEDQSPTGDISVEIHQQDLVKQPTSDDDNDAPEVATTKGVSSQRASRTKSKPRTPKTVAVPREHKIVPDEVVGGDEKGSSSLTGHEESSQAIVTPSININGSQANDLAMSPTSDDVDDLAFVTARTHRHFDPFATPQSSVSHVISPSIDQMNAIDDATRMSEQAADLLNQSLFKNLATRTTLVSTSKLARSGMAANTLPAKAGNSLERYRQQMQRNRLENKGDGRRGARFKLQEEWKGKRSQFVVGHEILNT